MDSVNIEYRLLIVKESGPKLGLRCLAHLMRVFAMTVNGLQRAQGKTKFPEIQVPVEA